MPFFAALPLAAVSAAPVASGVAAGSAGLAAGGAKGGLSLGSILGIAGPALSAFGSLQRGQASSNAASLQAQILRQQADQEARLSRQREEDFRRDQGRLMASRRAALGATGVESGTGSPLLVSQDFAAETERQAARIRQGGEIRRTRLEQQAFLTRREGDAARTASFFRAGSSLLSGIGSAARVSRLISPSSASVS